MKTPHFPSIPIFPFSLQSGIHWESRLQARPAPTQKGLWSSGSPIQNSNQGAFAVMSWQVLVHWVTKDTHSHTLEAPPDFIIHFWLMIAVSSAPMRRMGLWSLVWVSFESRFWPSASTRLSFFPSQRERLRLKSAIYAGITCVFRPGLQ